MISKSKKINVHKVALLAILTSISIVIAIIESFIPSIGIPGVKLGLTNIVILIILYELGVLEAIIVDLLRVFLVSFIRGTFLSMGFVMSLTGAILSIAVMVLLHLVIKKFLIVGVSVLGAIAHVTGQIIIAVIYLGSGYVFYYLPVIALSAVITGIFVGIVAQLIINTRVIQKQKERYKF